MVGAGVGAVDGGSDGRHGACDGAQMVSVSQGHTESQSIEVK